MWDWYISRTSPYTPVLDSIPQPMSDREKEEELQKTCSQWSHTCRGRKGNEGQSPLTFQVPGTTYVVTKERPSMGWYERERERWWGVKAKTAFNTTLCQISGFQVTLHSRFTFCHYKDEEKEKEIPCVYNRIEFKAFVASSLWFYYHLYWR